MCFIWGATSTVCRKAKSFRRLFFFLLAARKTANDKILEIPKTTRRYIFIYVVMSDVFDHNAGSNLLLVLCLIKLLCIFYCWYISLRIKRMWMEKSHEHIEHSWPKLMLKDPIWENECRMLTLKNFHISCNLIDSQTEAIGIRFTSELISSNSLMNTNFGNLFVILPLYAFHHN